MPKGIPKSEGEKIGERFNVEYGKMRRKSKEDKVARKAEKAKKGECECGK